MNIARRATANLIRGCGIATGGLNPSLSARMPEMCMADRMGRPPRLSHADEFELYCYRKSGLAIKTCASFFRVSVPTANRIIAKFRRFDEQIEPAAREFRERINSLRDST